MGARAPARLAAVAALLLVAAIALHPAGRPSGSASSAGRSASVLAFAAICGALAAGCAMAAVRGLRELRGMPPGAPGARRRPQVVRQIVTLALCAALLLSPAGSLLLQRLGQLLDPSQRPVPTTGQQQPRPAGAGAARATPPVPQAAALGAVLVLLGVLTVAVVRRRQPRPEPVVEDSDDLPRAAAAGIAALDELSEGLDPRDRVIRAYAAMERVLAATGTPRRPADTPAELLIRAEASGRVPGGPIARLTELFRRARYSPAPVSLDEVAEARACLRQLQGAPATVRPDSEAGLRTRQ